MLTWSSAQDALLQVHLDMRVPNVAVTYLNKTALFSLSCYRP